MRPRAGPLSRPDRRACALPTLTLTELAGSYGIARLPADAAIPAWADGGGLVSMSRTDDELSVLCLAARIPDNVKRDLGWTALKFEGPFAFQEHGILLSVIAPVSGAGIGVFVISTFDTDYLLVKNENAARVRDLLSAAGHMLR